MEQVPAVHGVPGCEEAMTGPFPLFGSPVMLLGFFFLFASSAVTAAAATDEQSLSSLFEEHKLFSEVHGVQEIVQFKARLLAASEAAMSQNSVAKDGASVAKMSAEFVLPTLIIGGCTFAGFLGARA